MKKNRKKYIAVGIICACFFALTGCQKTENKTNTAFSLNDFVMDTVLSESVYGKKDVTKDIKSLLGELEKEQLSWREAGSQVSVINETCGRGESAKMSEDFVFWTKTSLDLAKRSNGAFDPTIGNLTRLWDIEGGNPVVPEEKDIKDILQSVGYDRINIEEKESAITMEEGCTLDLGAVGKGIGCDVAKEYLDGQKEVSGAVISIGGSILVYGHKPDESPWKVAVRDPKGAGGDAMGYLSLDRTACVSTSGDYEKYFEQDGKRYHHILNPSTGYPAESGLSSVTVICEVSEENDKSAGLLSDGLSTACFVLGKEKGRELLESYGAEGIFIDKEGNVFATEKAAQYFTLMNEKYELKNF